MAKPTWDATPFESIKAAHELAEKLKLFPGEISFLEDRKLLYFQWFEGRDLHTIAQAAAGGPVKEQVVHRGKVRRRDPGGPTWGQLDKWVVGPWSKTIHENLEAARESFLSKYSNPDNVEVFHVLLVRDGYNIEWEYLRDGDGVVWSRPFHDPDAVKMYQK